MCQAPSTWQQEECHLLEQCRGLDKAVVQLTEFVQQNQVSLNRVLLAEQKAWWVSEWALGWGGCPPSMVPQGEGQPCSGGSPQHPGLSLAGCSEWWWTPPSLVAPGMTPIILSLGPPGRL